MRATLSGAFLLALAVQAPAADDAYRAEVGRWRTEREARLKADGGWLSVAGLFWLTEGENRFGTDPGGEIVLPKGSAPDRVGVFILAGRQVTARLEPGTQATIAGKAVGAAVELKADSSGAPDVLEAGRLSLHVIERGGRFAIRLKDRENPARTGFRGLDWFEVDESYRVKARWVPYDPPKQVKVPNVLGRSEPMPSPGRAEFAIGGQTVSLDGVLDSPDSRQIFFIFRDRTTGIETYGAGRFLYADAPAEGTLILDFNRAYSPPCAFTPYATCPLPPPQNALPVRIEAGEKAYAGGH